MMGKQPPDGTRVKLMAEGVLQKRHFRSVVLVMVLLAFGALLYAMTVVKLIG